MKKKLKWIVAVVAVLLIVAVVGVVLNLNRIVRVAVEKGSTDSLKVPTTLGGASLGLLSGDVSISDYEVKSPAGFDSPHMLKLGKLSVDTSYGKVFGKPVSIDSIRIDKPQLVLEFKGTKSNVKALADNLGPSSSTEPLKLIIDDLQVSGASVVLKSDMLGGKEYTIEVPPIAMAGIGNADGNRNGEEAGKVVSQIVSRLTLEAQKSGKIPPELAMILTGDLNDLVGKLDAQFQGQVAKYQEEAKAKIEALQTEVTGKITEKQAELENKAKAMQDEAKKKLGNELGNLLGGDKKKDEKKPDEKK